jgi:hypothetical protein
MYNQHLHDAVRVLCYQVRGTAFLSKAMQPFAENRRVPLSSVKFLLDGTKIATTTNLIIACCCCLVITKWNFT